MAILISGIERSGTTNVYQMLRNGLLAQKKHARCLFEPDMWNIPLVDETKNTDGQPFKLGQVGLYNMMMHCYTPLFLSGRNMLHDAWLRKVFDPINPSARMAPDNVLVKIMRSSGRLEAALTRFDNLKVVIITRNVVDTVNSGLGTFSYFGDEFHPSDKGRFIREINERFNAGINASLLTNEAHWSALWWRYFTQEAIQTYEKYPDRVLLVPYEKYTDNKREVIGNIFEFTGIDRVHIDQTLFNKDDGENNSVSYLDAQAIDQLSGENWWYFQRLSEVLSCTIDPLSYRRKLIEHYSKRKFSKSLLLTEKTSISAVELKEKLNIALTQQESKLSSLRTQYSKNNITRYTVARAVAEFGSNEAALKNARLAKFTSDGDSGAKRTVGVLITCFNNENTIAEAIYSALSQSKKPDLVVVADDCSTDSSVIIIKEIAAKHKEVQIEARAENVGVAANRDLAIRGMNTDYITTLDGDDFFMPGKLELEYLALAGALDTVAFSSIAVLAQKENFVQDTAAYSGKSRQLMLNMLTSRSTPVPRDMMFPKQLFEQANGFDVGMDIYEDWAFKMRLMAVSRDAGWVYSGGIGTIYDRRSPGLSGKPPIFHAHGQLLALARNANIFEVYPEALYGGLKTVSKPLTGELKVKLDRFIDLYIKNKDTLGLKARLQDFWARSTFDNDIKKKEHDISKFLD